MANLDLTKYGITGATEIVHNLSLIHISAVCLANVPPM